MVKNRCSPHRETFSQMVLFALFCAVVGINCVVFILRFFSRSDDMINIQMFVV